MNADLPVVRPKPKAPAVIRPQGDIDEILALAETAIDLKIEQLDQTFEEGVIAALEWVTGHRSNPPVEAPE